MRHRNAGRKLGLTSSHRKAMFRNLVTSLFEHERVVTTVSRAKEVRRLADKMITLGKSGTLHARRQALSVLRNKNIVDKIFGPLSQSLMERSGGYTRILHTGYRLGDAASMAILEIVNYQNDIEHKTLVKSD